MKTLKDFTDKKTPKVVMDERGQYRLSKICVSANNNLVFRYYLPVSKIDRQLIKMFKEDYEVPLISVYQENN